MAVQTMTSSPLEKRRTQLPRRRRSAPAPVQQGRPPELRISVHTLRDHWSAAFDAAQAALRAARRSLPASELGERARRLAAERTETALLLQAYAQNERAGAQYVHLRLAPWEARQRLGLPAVVNACIFNMDGILIGSAALHAAAWTQTFDELISRRVERTGGRFASFNPRTDYSAYIHGRPRLEGVRTFLASRGMRLPEGRPDDRAGGETVHGLANRKNEMLLRLLDERGLTAFEGSRRYLELVQDAGMRCGVVSASANVDPMLERAGLTDLVDARVDGTTIVSEQLGARPAPDILLAACRELGVEPEHTAVFETSPAGVRAARIAGSALVVGVDRAGEAKPLRDEGADLVVTGLAEILDRRRAA
jgi:HAD superfamily hydrolase (TIGR01509 family)